MKKNVTNSTMTRPTIALVTAETPVMTPDAIVEALACSRSVIDCRTALICSSLRFSGGPVTQSWIRVSPAAALSAMSCAWLISGGVMRAITPPSTTNAPSTTASAARAGGQPLRRNHAVGGQSAVESVSASRTGSTMTHNWPRT